MGNNKNIKTILITVLACFALILVIAVIRVLTLRKPIELYNVDQINTGMTDQEIDDLEKYVGESLKANEEYKDIVGIKALIRPASFERQEKDGVVLYKFLMDLDEYKATYEVSFGLAIGKGFYEPPRVACPLPAQMKYPETNCVGQRATTSVSTFEFKLPYYFRLDSGEFVTVTAEYADDGKEYLNVRVSSCGNTEIMNNARTEVEKWIKSLDYEPDDYEIKVPEFCDGGAN